MSPEQLEAYFSELVDSHSWSTVKVDRNGLQFFWRYVLKRDWDWIHSIKPPKITTIPDILTPAEIERIIGKTRKLRYRVFLLTTYSMGLRLEETLSLQVGDIDAERKRVHIRRGKGHKDRLVPLPDLTLQGLRALWRRHRHPNFLFPIVQVASPNRISFPASAAVSTREISGLKSSPLLKSTGKKRENLPYTLISMS